MNQTYAESLTIIREEDEGKVKKNLKTCSYRGNDLRVSWNDSKVGVLLQNFVLTLRPAVERVKKNFRMRKTGIKPKLEHNSWLSELRCSSQFSTSHPIFA